MTDIIDLTEPNLVDLSDEEEQVEDKPLSPPVAKQVNLMTKTVFGPESSSPTTEKELEAAEALAADMQAEDTQLMIQEAIYKGASTGNMTKEKALNIIKGFQDDPEVSRKTALVRQFAQVIMANKIANMERERERAISEQEKAMQEKVENTVAKWALLSLRSKQAKSEAEGVDWGEIALSTLPFYDESQANKLSLSNKTYLLSGNAEVASADEAYRMVFDPNVSPEDLEELLDNITKDLSTHDKARFYAALDAPDKSGNIFSVLNVLPLAGVAKGAVKGVKKASMVGESLTLGGIKGAVKGVVTETVPFGETITGAIKKPVSTIKLDDIASAKKFAGDSTGATESLAKDWASMNKARQAGVPTNQLAEVTENDMPTILKQSLDSISMPTVENMPSLARKASLLTEKGLQEYERLYASAIKAKSTQLARLNKESQEAYIRGIQEEVLEKYPSTPSVFHDLIGWGREVEKGGDLVLKARVGTGLTSSEGFIDKASAELVAKEINKGNISYTGGAAKANVSQIGGKYFVDVEMNLGKNQGTILSGYLSSTGQGRKVDSSAPSIVQAVSTLPNLAHDVRVLNSVAFQGVESTQGLIDSMVKSIGKLSKKDKKDLEVALESSRHKRMWYTPEELTMAGASDQVVEAYGVRRVLNDIAYMFDNAQLREQMKASGYRKINGILGRVVGTDKLPKGKHVYAIRANGTTGRPFYLDDIKYSDWKLTENHTIVKPLDDLDGSEIDYLLVPNSELLIEDLPQHIMNYVAGGRAYYSEKSTFIKQMTFGRDTIEGVQRPDYFRGFKTFFADEDASKAIRFAEDLEDLRMRYITGELTNEYLQSKNPVLLPFANVEEFAKWMKEEGIDLHPWARVEAVKDKTPLASYEAAVKEGKLEGIDEDGLRDTTNLSYYYLQKHRERIRTHHRTDRQLYDLLGRESVRADIGEELDHLRRNIESAGGMDLYTNLYAERFHSLYQDVIYNGDKMTPYEALMYGEFKPSTGALRDKVIAGKNAQANFKAIKGIPSDAQKAVDDFVMQAISKVDNLISRGKDSYTSSKNYSKLYENLKEKDLLKKFRKFAFHWTFGFLSSPQAIRQFMQVINSAALADPRALPRTLSLYLPAIMHFTQGANPKSSKTLSRILSSIQDADMAVDDVEAVLEAFENMPNMKGLPRSVDLEDYTKTRLERFSALPMIVGETGARIFNNLLAVVEAGIGANRRWGSLSELERANILERANNLYLNMNRTGLSRVQASGVGKLLTQMLTFNMRFTDMLLDPEIARGAKFRLAATLLATTGINGMFSTVGLAGLGYLAYSHISDDDAEGSSEAYRSIMDGVFNVLIQYLTDKPFDFFAGNKVQLLDAFMGYKDLADLQIPSVTVASEAGKALYSAYKALSFKVDSDIDMGTFMNIVQGVLVGRLTPSGIDRYYQAYLISKHGVLLDKRGYLTDKDRNLVDAALVLCGFEDQTALRAHLLRKYSGKIEERRKETVKAIREIWAPLLSEGDIQGAIDIYKLYTNEYNPTDRAVIFKELLQYYKSFGFASLERFERYLYTQKFNIEDIENIQRYQKITGGNNDNR